MDPYIIQKFCEQKTDTVNSMNIDYKLWSAIFLCTTFILGILLYSVMKNENPTYIQDTKKQIKKEIDSLETSIKKENILILKEKDFRKPIELRRSERDGSIVEMTLKKEDDFEKILVDSADADIRELDGILTDLVREYKIP